MFYVRSDSYEGTPAELYRRPEQIRRDMDGVRKSIDSIMERLNSRSILTEVLASLAEREPARWIPELEAIVAEASESLAALNELRSTLDELSRELEDTKCILQGK